MNYEFNMLHHVGVGAKRLRVAAAAETAAQKGDDNTRSGPTGRGLKTNVLWRDAPVVGGKIEMQMYQMI